MRAYGMQNKIRGIVGRCMCSDCVYDRKSEKYISKGRARRWNKQIVRSELAEIHA